jgi:hypothetical protein
MNLLVALGIQLTFLDGLNFDERVNRDFNRFYKDKWESS